MDEAARIRSEILQKTREYYEAAVREGQKNFDIHTPFKEGQAYVNYAGRYFNEQELCNLLGASLDFWLTYGEYSSKFESSLAKFLGVRHCLLVNSGSSANLLAFMALTSPDLQERSIHRGDEVITVAAGFPTTVAPIIQFGAIPVFVDVDTMTANVDPGLLEAAFSEKTKAVFLAHTLGNPFNLKRVQTLCRERDVWLVEDNCDALGSLYEGKYTGTFGDIGTSSFYPPHHITMGEGGAVYTDNKKLNRILLSLRDWGRDCWCASGKDNTCGRRFSQQFGSLPLGYDHKYVYGHFGYNLKATDMQAAVGLAQLDKLPEFIRKRRENHEFLKNRLQKYSDYFIFQQAEEYAEPSWFGFLMTITDKGRELFSRNEVVSALEERRIQTRALFSGNLTRHPCFDDLRKGQDYRVCGSLTNTDSIMNNSFWIGVYPGMTESKLEYMCRSLELFLGSRGIKQ